MTFSVRPLAELLHCRPTMHCEVGVLPPILCSRAYDYLKLIPGLWGRHSGIDVRRHATLSGHTDQQKGTKPSTCYPSPSGTPRLPALSLACVSVRSGSIVLKNSPEQVFITSSGMFYPLP